MKNPAISLVSTVNTELCRWHRREFPAPPKSRNSIKQRVSTRNPIKQRVSARNPIKQRVSTRNPIKQGFHCTAEPVEVVIQMRGPHLNKQRFGQKIQPKKLCFLCFLALRARIFLDFRALRARKTFIFLYLLSPNKISHQELTNLLKFPYPNGQKIGK